MDEHNSELLESARGLATAKALIDRAIKDLVCEAIESDVNISSLASVLAISRSTIYRHADAEAARALRQRPNAHKIHGATVQQ